MVFVFLKSAYGGSKRSNWGQLGISLGLFIGMAAYILVGAALFLYLNPTYVSQGVEGTFNTTFLDATYFMMVTITTVGYGEIVTENDETKVFLTVYILLSLVLVGVLLEVTDFVFQIDVEALEEDDSKEAMVFRPRRKLLWAIFLVFLVMLSSAIFFVFHEDFTAVDAMYFTVVSLTTVGYGDITPRTDEGKLFSVFWIGLGCLTLFRTVGALMDVMLESRKAKWKEQRESRTAVIRQHLSARLGATQLVNLTTAQALQRVSKEDLVAVLTKMEYIMYRLEADGFATTEDLQRLDDEFKALTPEQLDEQFDADESSMVFRALA